MNYITKTKKEQINLLLYINLLILAQLVKQFTCSCYD